MLYKKRIFRVASLFCSLFALFFSSLPSVHAKIPFMPEFFNREMSQFFSHVPETWVYKFGFFIILLSVLHYSARRFIFKDDRGKGPAVVVSAGISLLSALLIPVNLVTDVFKSYAWIFGLALLVGPIVGLLLLARNLGRGNNANDRFSKAARGFIFGIAAYYLGILGSNTSGYGDKINFLNPNNVRVGDWINLSDIAQIGAVVFFILMIVNLFQAINFGGIRNAIDDARGRRGPRPVPIRPPLPGAPDTLNIVLPPADFPNPDAERVFGSVPPASEMDIGATFTFTTTPPGNRDLLFGIYETIGPPGTPAPGNLIIPLAGFGNAAPAGVIQGNINLSNPPRIIGGPRALPIGQYFIFVFCRNVAGGAGNVDNPPLNNPNTIATTPDGLPILSRAMRRIRITANIGPQIAALNAAVTAWRARMNTAGTGIIALMNQVLTENAGPPPGITIATFAAYQAELNIVMGLGTGITTNFNMLIGPLRTASAADVANYAALFTTFTNMTNELNIRNRDYNQNLVMGVVPVPPLQPIP